MRRSLRVLASLATLVIMLGLLAPAALAAGPERFVIDLDDPQIDVDESAWASEWCGFAVDAQVSGHVIVTIFPEDARSPSQINVYGTRVTYANVATGAVVRLRDVGPDRFYTKDGKAYVAITGRSVTGSGVIGVVIVDLDTGEAVFQAGNEAGNFNDQFCAAID